MQAEDDHAGFHFLCGEEGEAASLLSQFDLGCLNACLVTAQSFAACGRILAVECGEPAVQQAAGGAVGNLPRLVSGAR